MATRQKKSSSFKGDIKNFADVNNFLSGFDTGGKLLDDFKEIDVPYWINSGSLFFNLQVSGSMKRGIPSGRITTIAGHPKTGKSYFAFNIVREFQKDGGFVYFFETEGSPTKKRMEGHGIKTDQLRLYQPETVHELLVILVRMTEGLKEMQQKGQELPKIMVVIDSLTGLLSGKQLKDLLKNEVKQDMGTVAKDLKLMFNFCSKRFSKLGITMICTSHIYEKHDEMFKEEVISGGTGSVYYSSIIVGLRKRFERDDTSKEKVSVIVISELIESRFSIPKKIALKIPFTKPMNPYLGIDLFTTPENSGIGKGKWVAFYDLANMFLSKDKVKQSEIKNFVFTISDIEKNIGNKDKAEYADWVVKYLIKNEEIIILGGGSLKSNSRLMFTDKVNSNIKDNKHNRVDNIEVVPFFKESCREYIASHLPNKTFDYNKLFTPDIFTQKIIDDIDDIIRPKWELSSDENESPYAIMSVNDDMTEEEIQDSLDEILKLNEK